MGWFERELLDEAEWRQAGIVSRLPRPSRPRDDGMDGFVSLRDAAAAMGLAEQEVAELARRGALETLQLGGRVLVRPGIVTSVGVRTVA